MKYKFRERMNKIRRSNQEKADRLFILDQVRNHGLGRSIVEKFGNLKRPVRDPKTFNWSSQ